MSINFTFPIIALIFKAFFFFISLKIKNICVSDLTARDVYSRRCQVLEKKEEERAKMIEKHIKETKRLQKNDLLASWDPTRVYQFGQIYTCIQKRDT